MWSIGQWRSKSNKLLLFIKMFSICDVFMSPGIGGQHCGYKDWHFHDLWPWQCEKCPPNIHLWTSHQRRRDICRGGRRSSGSLTLTLIQHSLERNESVCLTWYRDRSRIDRFGPKLRLYWSKMWQMWYLSRSADCTFCS